jgi:hypothetical protein
VPLNLDVPAAVRTVLTALPRLDAFRPLLKELPDFDIVRFDRLQDYAFAVAHSHAVFSCAGTAPRTFDELGAEALRMRETLMSDALALARRGLIDGSRLSPAKSPGYRGLAFDLLAAVNLFRDRWFAVEGKTGVTSAQLDHAELLVDRLVRAMGSRQQTPLSQTPLSQSTAAEDHQRAFTLLARAYADARRAISDSCWHEQDIDEIAPSIYSGKRHACDDLGVGEATDAPDAASAPRAVAETLLPASSPTLPPLPEATLPQRSLVSN